MHNRIILITLLITLVSASFRSLPDEGIKLTITNLRNDKGFVLISLFKEGVGFPDQADKAFRKDKVAIYNKMAVIIFPELPPGNYAIAILHDENDDKKMNKNVVGLPREGYGFSNNVMAPFGPPSYRRASFKHPGKTLTELSIRARY